MSRAFSGRAGPGPAGAVWTSDDRLGGGRRERGTLLEVCGAGPPCAGRWSRRL